MDRLLRCLLAFLVASWFMGAPLTHASDYTFQTIDFAGADEFVIYDINNAGQMVGTYDVGSVEYGFLYDGTDFTTIAVPGAVETSAFGINDAGHVVGSYEDAEGNKFGFLYDGTGFTTITVDGAEEVFAFGINNNGLVVGLADARTFVYDGTDYQVIDIPISFIKNDINNAGQIVGNYLIGAGEVEAAPLPTRTPLRTVTRAPNQASSSIGHRPPGTGTPRPAAAPVMRMDFNWVHAWLAIISPPIWGDKT
ncbi:MAG: hypothetical protein P8X58_12235 [Syntrophobacterales bacterium]